MENVLQDNKIIIESDMFMDLRAGFNKILGRTLTSMKQKGSDNAELTVKLSIGLTEEYSDDNECVYRPDFKHKVSSILKVKDEISGRDSGEFAIVFDEETGECIARKTGMDQINIDEFENEEDTAELLMIEGDANNALPDPEQDDDIIDAEYEEVE
ncbi:MAG: hypothetical protein MRZ66_02455 [Clostridiales bacterium]|nr:hypothetical protein [Clostridiales bacterium]